MADVRSPETRLVIGFFKLPPAARYVPRTATKTTTDGVDTYTYAPAPAQTKPSYSYMPLPTISTWQFLDTIWPDLQIKFARDASDFVAAISDDGDTGDWTLRFNYDPDRPGDLDLLDFIDTTCGVIWFLETAAITITDSQFRGYLGSGYTRQPGSSPDRGYYVTDIPDFLRQGSGGKVVDIRTTEERGQPGLVEIYCEDWGRKLEQTMNKSPIDYTTDTLNTDLSLTSPPILPTEGTTPKALKIQAILDRIFFNSCDYGPDEHTLRPPTQVGKWLMRVSMTRAARDHINSNYADKKLIFPTGRNLRKIIKEMCGELELRPLFSSPQILIDTIATGDPVYLDARHNAIKVSLGQREPDATMYSLPHRDAEVDDIIYSTYSPDNDDPLDLMDDYGAIERQLVSLAPKHTEPREDVTAAAALAEVRDYGLEQIARQAARDSTTDYGMAMITDHPAAHLGTTIRLGTPVRLVAAGRTSALMRVNKITIARAGTAAYAITLGLGEIADIAPQLAASWQITTGRPATPPTPGELAVLRSHT